MVGSGPSAAEGWYSRNGEYALYGERRGRRLGVSLGAVCGSPGYRERGSSERGSSERDRVRTLAELLCVLRVR